MKLFNLTALALILSAMPVSATQAADFDINFQPFRIEVSGMTSVQRGHYVRLDLYAVGDFQGDVYWNSYSLPYGLRMEDTYGATGAITGYAEFYGQSCFTVEARTSYGQFTQTQVCMNAYDGGYNPPTPYPPYPGYCPPGSHYDSYLGRCVSDGGYYPPRPRPDPRPHPRPDPRPHPRPRPHPVPGPRR